MVVLNRPPPSWMSSLFGPFEIHFNGDADKKLAGLRRDGLWESNPAEKIKKGFFNGAQSVRTTFIVITVKGRKTNNIFRTTITYYNAVIVHLYRKLPSWCPEHSIGVLLRR